MQYEASVVITTRDRKTELEQAVCSVMSQSANVEILVYDDGSTDGTAELIQRRFPGVRLVRGEQSLGIVAARNRAIPLALAPIVFVIDDDCVFSAPDTIRATLQDFCDSRIAAVAIPHVNVHSGPTVFSAAPGSGGIHAISEFTGCAHAVRKDVFVRLGGYRSGYWRQCEEYDFCTRLLAHGYITRSGTAAPIWHRESAHRNTSTIAFHRARGHLLYAWYNVPWPALGAHAVATSAKCAAHAAREGNLPAAMRGFGSAIFDIATRRCHRQPVSWRAYALMRRLRRCGPLQLSSLGPALEVPQRLIEVEYS